MHRRNTDIWRRSRQLKAGRAGTGPIVYWMSRDQRVFDNWALLWAQQEGMIHEKSILVVFCLTPNFPDTNPAQVIFMAKGLPALAKELKQLGIGLAAIKGTPDAVLPQLLVNLDAHSLVSDFNPLITHTIWQDKLVEETTIPFYEVDSHNIIPVWTTSNKKEYAAYTIRPKIKRLLDDYLTDIPTITAHPFPFTSTIPKEHDHELSQTLYNNTAPSALSIASGTAEAIKAAQQFTQTHLNHYGSKRNDPCQNGQSGLSPYLHFGQLSAQRLAKMVLELQLDEEVTEPFLEEMIVRRELSDNFCLYEKRYDSMAGFSEWAQKTLHQHRDDVREYTYTFEAFEAGKTHELLWNCCQLDLVHTGKLHGFLRMYWAKKILEWSPTPEAALSFANTLNNRYSIDGHDPNGYTGVAWSIGGVHDRAWGERSVFGKIRYMNAAGCRRKFDVDSYTTNVLKITD